MSFTFVFLGTAFSPCIAQLDGHTSAHDPQPMHASASCLILYAITLAKILFFYKAFATTEYSEFTQNLPFGRHELPFLQFPTQMRDPLPVSDANIIQPSPGVKHCFFKGLVSLHSRSLNKMRSLNQGHPRNITEPMLHVIPFYLPGYLLKIRQMASVYTVVLLRVVYHMADYLLLYPALLQGSYLL